VFCVRRAKASRHELFDGFTRQLPGTVTEHFLGLPVRQDNKAAGIDHDDSIGHRLQQVTELRLG
jgi:hypothetical protein